jgi:hypothetical protein
VRKTGPQNDAPPARPLCFSKGGAQAAPSHPLGTARRAPAKGRADRRPVVCSGYRFASCFSERLHFRCVFSFPASFGSRVTFPGAANRTNPAACTAGSGFANRAPRCKVCSNAAAHTSARTEAANARTYLRVAHSLHEYTSVYRYRPLPGVSALPQVALTAQMSTRFRVAKAPSGARRRRRQVDSQRLGRFRRRALAAPASTHHAA